jgi:hypothetical protein
VFNKTARQGLTDGKGGRNQPPNSKLEEREGKSEDGRGIRGRGDTFGGGNRRWRRRGSRIEVERGLDWTRSEKRRRPTAGETSVKCNGNLSEMFHRSWRPLQNKLSSPPPPPCNLHLHLRLHPSFSSPTASSPTKPARTPAPLQGSPLFGSLYRGDEEKDLGGSEGRPQKGATRAGRHRSSCWRRGALGGSPLTAHGRCLREWGEAGGGLSVIAGSSGLRRFGAVAG